MVQRDHGSQVVVVLEFHLGEPILNIIYPSCVVVVEMTVNLVQLIL